MQLQLTTTGEYTLYIPEMDETYHSRNGAISEAKHVFLQECLEHTTGDISVLEIGFGTGLNAMLTAQYAEQHKRKITFYTLEPIPVPLDILAQIGYGKALKDENLFNLLHTSVWESDVNLSPYFLLHKTVQKLQDISLETNKFDCIFFDAFAPKKQPELWSLPIFEKLYAATKNLGVLSTYSAAGQLKRDLKTVGYSITNPLGANGKREMTVAIKG